MLAVAGALTVAGAALQGYAWVRGSAEPPSVAATEESTESAPPTDSTGAIDPDLVAGLAPDDPAHGDESQSTDAGVETVSSAVESDPLAEWSPVIFRLGFSFFVGFVIAYALRTFLKIALLAAGVLILALFGLQYAGLIDVNWGAIEGRYDGIIAWLKDQSGDMTQFIQGYLPSTASAALGFVVGWRRK